MTITRAVGLAALCLLLCAAFSVRAQPASGGPVDAVLIDDLVAANRILALEGILDGWGHVSVRHSKNPNRYFMSRNLAAELVTRADIMEIGRAHV